MSLLGHARPSRRGTRACRGRCGTRRRRSSERRARLDAPRHHRHGVRVVQQQRAGADARPCPRPSPTMTGIVRSPRMMPPMPMRVGDRLPHAVLRAGPRSRCTVASIAADLDLVDEVVGAVEGGAPVGVGARPGTRRRTIHDLVGGPLRVPQPLGIDVVQGDRRAAPWSSGKEERSARMFRVNSTLPAPMIVTFVMRGSVADGHETSKNENARSAATSVPWTRPPDPPAHRPAGGRR